MDFSFILDILSSLSSFVNIVRVFFGLSSLYGIYSFFRNYVLQKVELSIGSFYIRPKHFNVQQITNIVSAHFYDGGQVPPEVRHEIIMLTCPKVKNLVKHGKDQNEK